MLSKQAIVEYQQIYKEVYGEKISYKEALRQGLRLLSLFKAIYKPIPEGVTNLKVVRGLNTTGDLDDSK